MPHAVAFVATSSSSCGKERGAGSWDRVSEDPVVEPMEIAAEEGEVELV